MKSNLNAKKFSDIFGVSTDILISRLQETLETLKSKGGFEIAPIETSEGFKIKPYEFMVTQNRGVLYHTDEKYMDKANCKDYCYIILDVEGRSKYSYQVGIGELHHSEGVTKLEIGVPIFLDTYKPHMLVSTVGLIYCVGFAFNYVE